ncbi:hypothetical protein RUM43_003404 [Polyplax serrata]|uniref:General vesicular transport factor p115 n=1 Tax=Polyplax serrata TaxID=468196 RepID=A0AAN8S5I9_POLSC
MEYFRSGLKSVLGSSQPGDRPSAPETIEKLVDRVKTSTLLEDRRDACRALKSLSKKYRVEVGAQGMDAFVHSLQTDSNDCELVGYVLDTLCNVTSPETFEDEDQPVVSGDLSKIGAQFTEIFIKQPENVGLVLAFLDEFDFRVRWPAIKLLISLIENKTKEIQEIVLVSPMAVSKLMDLLGDSREIIRNDVLLLLIQLTKGNANIQKIVAFENAFDRIFEVIKDEGFADGGIIVQDSFLLMLNLLRNNTSNINFFKEGSYIQKCAPMFALPTDGVDTDNWTSQRVANVHCMLQVIRTLVSPSNPTQITSSCQGIMKSSGLLEELCSVLMASGVPADILTETINTVAEVIRGNFTNQEYFAGVMAPSTPPRPVIVVLLMSMVNEKQPFVLRCAVLYCFQCFLFKNEFGQAQLIQTLLPSSSQVTALTCGQLLCGGLFSPDPLSNWFSAVALSHGVIENPVEKEQLLKVMLATSPGATPVSLLHQCSLLLQQNNQIQSKFGLLMLLCMWLSHCPQAVSQFLSIPSNIPFLTAQTASMEHDETQELLQGLCSFLMGICVNFNDNSVPSFSKENLCQIISKRIGVEMFLDKLGEVSKHEQYTKASKHPNIRAEKSADLLLDHEFCRLFKALEGLVGKAVSPKVDFMNGSDVPDSVLLLQYKEVIRDQDNKLQVLETEVGRLRGQEAVALKQLQELHGTVQQLKDENVLLRAHASSSGSDFNFSQELSRQIEYYKNEVEQWKNQYMNMVAHKDMEIQQLKAAAVGSQEVEKEMESLAISSTGDAEKQLREELSRERQKITEVEKKLSKLEETESELDRLKKDQDNLLELLSEQEEKLEEFRCRLRQLGQKVDDEDDEVAVSEGVGVSIEVP